MAKTAVSRDDLRKKVAAAFKYEACCEGVSNFEITRHEPNEMSVNWTVKLLSPDPDGKCYAAASTVIALLAKAYALAE
jgi:hypothetical protein